MPGFGITEVSEGGSVPTLRVVNETPQHVLLFDGEELKGAKQNRILNTSILVAAGASLDVPVSCTERGRWSYDSPKATPPASRVSTAVIAVGPERANHLAGVRSRAPHS